MLENRGFIAQLMKNAAKRNKEEGCCKTCMKVVYWPLDIVRKYTMILSDEESWDKTRAIFLPILFPWAFFWCFARFNGLLIDGEYDKVKDNITVASIMSAVGLIFSIIIYFSTSKAKRPTWI
jgi:hypothetical protein